MANPPPVRPWFRLTSIRPVPTPAPAPAPAPEPRPTLALPTFRTASAPPSPQTHSTQPQPQEKKAEHSSSSPPRKVVPSSHSSSLPSSPLQKAPPHSQQPPSTSSTSSPDKTATATHSPKTIKQTVRSPIHSPKTKPTAPPPSPLTLPPSQLKNEQEQPKIPTEAEHKAVLVQKTVDKPKPWHNGNGELHRETRNHNSSHHGKHVAGKERETKERKGSDSEDSGMRVITIAGENRGAYMELINSPKKHETNFLHKKGKSKGKVDGGGESENSSAEEGNMNKKDKNQKGRTTSSSFPMAAYMNSNVQCVNNSLLYHTSCSHHDPGVRLSLSKKPFGEGSHLKEHVDGKNT